eukprot:222996_1
MSAHQCWSVNDIGLLGTRRLTKIYPNHMISCKTISNIITGKFGSTYVVSGDNQLIVFGSNRYNQLFLTSYSLLNTLQIILKYWHRAHSDTSLPPDILSSITLFCDYNYDYNSINVSQSTRIYNRYVDKIKHVSNGIASCHKFIITNTNELYGFGLNGCEQIREDTSNYNITRSATTYEKIDYFNVRNIKIIQIECALSYSTFLTSNGKLYVSGCDYTYEGVIYINWSEHQMQMRLVETLQNENIIQICNGDEHTLALNDNGKVFSWGRNTCGQLGRYSEKQSKPHIIDYCLTNSTKIISIKCGCEHNLLLDENGNIHCFGRNSEYQCSDVASMNQINKNYTFIGIKCGYNHNCVETNDHEYFLWGWNNKNQCCVFNDGNYVKKPTKFIANGIGRVVEIYPGYDQTRVITEFEDDHVVTKNCVVN